MTSGKPLVRPPEPVAVTRAREYLEAVPEIKALTVDHVLVQLLAAWDDLNREKLQLEAVLDTANATLDATNVRLTTILERMEEIP